MKQEERIICAAIWFKDDKEYIHNPKNIEKGYVICGLRHHNCFAILGQVLQPNKEYKELEEIQGFMTSLNRFVDRQEGWIIAEKAKQIIQQSGGHGTLYSEDLY